MSGNKNNKWISTPILWFFKIDFPSFYFNRNQYISCDTHRVKNVQNYLLLNMILQRHHHQWFDEGIRAIRLDGSPIKIIIVQGFVGVCATTNTHKTLHFFFHFSFLPGVCADYQENNNPVYERRVNILFLVCSLSAHRHSYIGFIFSSRFIDS